MSEPKPDTVLTCRLYFPPYDDGNAQNAFDHMKALMVHAQDAARQVGAQLDTSWVRLHECHATEDGGDTGRCETIDIHVIEPDPAPGDGGDGEEWVDGTTYPAGYEVTWEGVTYRSLVDGNHWGPPGSAGTETVWEPI